jgi:Fe(3+) dicitrate transport protein
MQKSIIISVQFVVSVLFLKAQNNNADTFLLQPKNLSNITIVGNNNRSDIQQIPDVVGTSIYAGKKNSLIVLKNVQGNIVNNTMRQVLAKVPGIHIWESDPSGIQIGIAARGLSPNRSWEFNIRQNGYDIAADPFGYPEAYYNPQMQSVQRIEIIRGQGSLQYGPQFGGLVNYILKDGASISKPFEFETEQTLGSNALFNSFNSIGGKKNKINYYAYFKHRQGNGWRDNSKFYNDAAFASITIAKNKKLSIVSEITYSHMRSQQPGGLTDSSFIQNAKQSVRGRNWFDITWINPVVSFLYTINETTRFNTKLFATIGDRNSVGNTSSILINDTINAQTLKYDNRVLNSDKYRNVGLESRFITNYFIGNIKNTFSSGIRFYAGNTHRLSKGTGTTGSNYDMTLIGQYPQDINFESKNAAAFFEQLFQVNNNLSIIPGARYEWIAGKASGRNSFSGSGNPILLQNITKSRGFFLLGMGIEYRIKNGIEFYTNLSEAYRPIQFANLQAPPTTDIIDPNLNDAKGYNFDLGYRGKLKNYLQFDVSGYYLKYKNRIGAITEPGTSYRLITNVGESISKGLECFIEINPLKLIRENSNKLLLLFCSYSFTDARYDKDFKDIAIRGKYIENAPRNIIRTGVSFGSKSFLLTAQYNFVDKVFSDANNTAIPTPNGQSGLIPSYNLIDLSANYKVTDRLEIKTGINNLLNSMYFTRRSSGYPGPGVLPADGRNCFLTLACRL